MVKEKGNDGKGVMAKEKELKSVDDHATGNGKMVGGKEGWHD